MVYYTIFLLPYVLATDAGLPLAPFNVKLFCRSGSPQTSSVRNPVKCPTSSTSCGYFEFEGKNDVEKTGIFECVDNGILLRDEDDDVGSEGDVLFENLCSAVPRCSNLHMEALNPSFLKYLINSQGIRLETLKSRTVRFCCALYHSTLQRLVNSKEDSLSSPAAPPVHCGGSPCEAGAVGCLLHSRYGSREHDTTGDEEEYEGEYAEGDYTETKHHKKPPPKQKLGHLEQKQKTSVRKYRSIDPFVDDYTDEDYSVKAVEISFGGEDEDQFLKGSFDVIEDETEDIPPPTKATSKGHTGNALNAAKTSTSSKHALQKVVNADDYAEEDYEDERGEENHYCVYRHLNDERYRYCLLIHSEKDGDRCYEHRGHTICCCFVPPESETCDPLELDLIIRPPPPLPTSKKTLIATTPSTTMPTITSTTTTTTSSISTTSTPAVPVDTTTTMEPTTSTSTTSMSPKRIRLKTIPRKPTSDPPNNGCRIVYPRGKPGHKRKPKLVCSTGKVSTFIVIFTIFLSAFYFV